MTVLLLKTKPLKLLMKRVCQLTCILFKIGSWWHLDLKTIASINKRLEASSAYINTGLSEHFQINLGRYLGFVVGTSWNNESAKSKWTKSHCPHMICRAWIRCTILCKICKNKLWPNFYKLFFPQSFRWIAVKGDFETCQIFSVNHLKNEQNSWT